MVDPDDLAGAQGKFAVFVASLLQRAGVAPMSEFAELLDVSAESVAETEPGEAVILARWAEAIGAAGGH
jgi:hypothetical protein